MFEPPKICCSKRIKDNANWLVSDQMLRYYCESFLNSFWPNGTSSSSSQTPPPEPETPPPKLTKEEKQKLRERAHNLICQWVHNNREDVYCLLLGEKNLTRGLIKIFTALQDEVLNRHLILRLIETVLVELISHEPQRPRSAAVIEEEGELTGNPFLEESQQYWTRSTN